MRANSISPAAVLKNDICNMLVPVFTRARVLLIEKAPLVDSSVCQLVLAALIKELV